ncbi:MAG: cysteine-rich CWC family protein [Verrucomicrobiia bacterium]
MSEPQPIESPDKKQCAGCGEPFVCEYSEGADSCWCFELPAMDPKAVDPGKECFCRDCLLKRLE